MLLSCVSATFAHITRLGERNTEIWWDGRRRKTVSHATAWCEADAVDAASRDDMSATCPTLLDPVFGNQNLCAVAPKTKYTFAGRWLRKFLSTLTSNPQSPITSCIHQPPSHNLLSLSNRPQPPNPNIQSLSINSNHTPYSPPTCNLHPSPSLHQSPNPTSDPSPRNPNLQAPTSITLQPTPPKHNLHHLHHLPPHAPPISNPEHLIPPQVHGHLCMQPAHLHTCPRAHVQQFGFLRPRTVSTVVAMGIAKVMVFVVETKSSYCPDACVSTLSLLFSLSNQTPE